MSEILKKREELFGEPTYPGRNEAIKINFDYVRWFAQEECYRELMVSYLPMIPLFKYDVPFEDADYIVYMHMYARCDDFSDFVEKHLRKIASYRKEGAEIIVVGKAANVKEKLKDIPNMTFWGDHYTEKLGKKFGVDIKEEYFVYDDDCNHLAIWPVDGCMNACKFCRRSYMYIKFESISLEVIKKELDFYKEKQPDQMKKISLRAENLTEYGIDIYGEQKLHELLELVESYDEVEEIEIAIGMNIGEITPAILEAICFSKKIKKIGLNIETGSDRLLKLIGKKHNAAKCKFVFKKIRSSRPDIYIQSTIMIGLPTEDVGDVWETSRIIAETYPDYVHVNYYILSKNSPLAKLPQLTEKCKEYHLKEFYRGLCRIESVPGAKINLDSYLIEKRPNSRSAIKRRMDMEEANKERYRYGLLPHHFDMNAFFSEKDLL